MNKGLISLILVFLAVFTVNCNAWVWETHQNIVDKVYSDMPRELQVKLNLSLMEEGSIAPDKVFHNNVLHHYPQSYELALKALNENNDWDNISYNFGIATHYISDSFSAPHYISNEPYKLHEEFEKQIKNYIPKTKCYNYRIDLKKGLENGSLNYREWGEWLLTKNKEIPEREVEQAMTLVYSIAFDKFNFNCNNKTRVEYAKGFFNWNGFFKFLIFIGIILVLYIVYRTIKRFKYKK